MAMLCKRCKQPFHRAYYYGLCIECLNEDVQAGKRSWLVMDLQHTLLGCALLAIVLLVIVFAMYLTRPGGLFDLFGG